MVAAALVPDDGFGGGPLGSGTLDDAAGTTDVLGASLVETVDLAPGDAFGGGPLGSGGREDLVTVLAYEVTLCSRSARRSGTGCSSPPARTVAAELSLRPARAVTAELSSRPARAVTAELLSRSAREWPVLESEVPSRPVRYEEDPESRTSGRSRTHTQRQEPDSVTPGGGSEGGLGLGSGRFLERAACDAKSMALLGPRSYRDT